MTPYTNVSKNKEYLAKVLEETESDKMILKPLNAYGGQGVILIEKTARQSFRSLLDFYIGDENTSNYVILQEYVEGAEDGDVRILMLNGEPIGAMRRVPSKGDVRSNVHAGGSAVKHVLSREEKELCRHIGEDTDVVGKEMFTRLGPVFVEQLGKRGFEVFLDLKFHDIPNTVARACEAAAALGVWMVNVHALGGRRMMEAAREAVSNSRHQPLLIAVTILTSLDGPELAEVGLSGEPVDNVVRLARLAEASGMDGVVILEGGA